ncbi:uncharacterized protein LOC135093525 [Scylla paramamosain]|uniref:uncharacterized protein LOC135093525 n=1 Tax=Scylla paramamosain TaxID=85552 RepID=UPI003082A7F4
MYSSVLWACMALCACEILLPPVEGEDLTAWRRVLVESSWFKESVIRTPKNLSLISCGLVCMRHDWCNLWRHDEPSACLLTSLFVSVSYQPSQPDGALPCYTGRKPEFTTRAAITSSVHYHANIKQGSNLVDGIYSSDIYDASIVDQESGAFAWFLLDFGDIIPISEVILVAQPNINSYHYFRDIEVRVGNTQASGNFASYLMLGSFTGPGDPEQIVILRPATPLFGRYVSIQRTTDGMLQIAHVEVR